MMLFFVIRFLILFSITSLQVVCLQDLGLVIANGLLIIPIAGVSLLSLIAYFLVLFSTSVFVSILTSSNQFPLNFRTVAVADTIFCYGLILITSGLFLTEAGISLSLSAARGELAVDGIKTPLGWQVSAQNAKTAIFCIIAIHALFLIHNFVATRRQPVADS